MYGSDGKPRQTVPLRAVPVGGHFTISDISVRPCYARRLLWLGVCEGALWCLVGRDAQGNVVLQKQRERVSLRAAWVQGIQVRRTPRAIVAAESPRKDWLPIPEGMTT
ncbi:MAG: ferrous iron transport protein A [Candidatus Competibacteraceae bacterium]|nr:ferrous iron transport protein A [Candidatus Competibacteraceae bacterium]